MQDPQPQFNPVPGRAEPLAPGLRRILCPNPSPMTFRGTNSYLVGQDELAVIDPGPDDDAHLGALLAGIGGARVRAILVTHAHVDHSALARRLSHATDAPVMAFGDAFAGRSVIMQQMAHSGLVGGGEGVDATFAPDVTLGDNDTVSGDGWHIEALHTPGHFGNHLCFAWGDRLFSGDIVMGWASSLVSPPDGDVSDFMRSLARLSARDWSTCHPGHGAPVPAPRARIAALMAHRQSREDQILNALSHSGGTAADLASRIYTDVPDTLHKAAARNVLAHLVDLWARNRVKLVGEIAENAWFSLVGSGVEKI